MYGPIKRIRFLRLASFIFSGAFVLSGQSAKSSEVELKVNSLGGLGLAPQSAIDAFQDAYGLTLDQDSLVRVSIDEEGSSLQLEVLDSFSIIVPHALAGGPFNKIVAFSTSNE